MKRWKIWAGLLTVFVSGLLIGALGSWITLEHRAMDMLAGHGRGFEKIILRKLDHRLGLTESQKPHVAKIICQTQERLRDIRRTHRPEMDAVIHESFEAIRAELSPAQQAKLDVMRRELKERRDKWLGPRESSPDGKDTCD